MNSNNNQTLHLKRELLARLIQAYYSDNFEENAAKVPFEMRPKHKKVPYRCCVFKERAILKERIIAALGFAVEDFDEHKKIKEYAKEAKQREKLEETVLTVLDTACIGCTPSTVYVTDLCQGCIARPCLGSCNFGAISIKNGRSVIDSSKCKNCTKCIQACPYNAIAKIRVPCEDSCPVGAIKKNEQGYAKIDFDKCIYCGACVSACPFGAVAEKSQLLDILEAIKAEKKVIAMLAPAIAGQLPVGIEKIAEGLIKTGFSSVYEVAQGADITALTEAEDFKEKMKEGKRFMTTSCCAAYNNYTEKHLPEIKPFMSETKTPLYYTAEIVKRENEDCISVFIGPCSAKRIEGQQNENIDYVMSFEEMGALFVALGIELSEMEDYKFKAAASKQGKNFPFTGGVAQSVITASGNSDEIKPINIDGLDKASTRELKKYAKNGCCPDGNLVEVMACKGGCLGGSAVLNDQKLSKKKVQEYSSKSEDLNCESES